MLDVLGAKRAQSDPMVDPNTDVIGEQADDQRAARLAERVMSGQLIGGDAKEDD